MGKNKKKKRSPEWYTLFLAYVVFFIGSDYIIKKHASFPVSAIMEGEYFNVKGTKAIVYGLILTVPSSLVFISEIFDFFRYNRYGVTNSRIFITWIVLFIYLLTFNLIYGGTIVKIVKIGLLLLLSIICIVHSYKFNKMI